MVVKSNAINTGLRTLEVARVSVVLKACVLFSAFPVHILISLKIVSSYMFPLLSLQEYQRIKNRIGI